MVTSIKLNHVSQIARGIIGETALCEVQGPCLLETFQDIRYLLHFLPVAMGGAQCPSPHSPLSVMPFNLSYASTRRTACILNSVRCLCSSCRAQLQLKNFTNDITDGQKASYLLLKLLVGEQKCLCKREMIRHFDSCNMQLPCCSNHRRFSSDNLSSLLI